MKRYMDVPRLNRLRRTAKILSFGGLGILVLALLLSLGSVENLGITLGLALTGLLTSQMGSILMRRWPDRGRSDQVFDAALKGLDSRNALFHYLLGSRHALLTPNGSLALVPVYEPGQFDSRGGSLWRTKVKRGKPAGDPRRSDHLVSEAEHEVRALQHDLIRRLERDDVEATAILVFFHPEARVNSAPDAIPAVHVKKLKDYIRSMPRRAPIAPAETAALDSSFDRFRTDE